MPIYEYRCRTCGVFDARASYDEDTAICVCGQEANRLGVYHVALKMAQQDKIDRQRTRDFFEASSEIDHAYTQVEKLGDPVKRPNYYREGVRKARKRNPNIRT